MGIPANTSTTGPFPIENVVDDVTGKLLTVLAYSAVNGGTWDAEEAASPSGVTPAELAAAVQNAQDARDAIVAAQAQLQAAQDQAIADTEADIVAANNALANLASTSATDQELSDAVGAINAAQAAQDQALADTQAVQDAALAQTQSDLDDAEQAHADLVAANATDDELAAAVAVINTAQAAQDAAVAASQAAQDVAITSTQADLDAAKADLAALAADSASDQELTDAVVAINTAEDARNVALGTAQAAQDALITQLTADLVTATTNHANHVAAAATDVELTALATLLRSERETLLDAINPEKRVGKSAGYVAADSPVTSPVGEEGDYFTALEAVTIDGVAIPANTVLRLNKDGGGDASDWDIDPIMTAMLSAEITDEEKLRLDNALVHYTPELNAYFDAKLVAGESVYALGSDGLIYQFNGPAPAADPTTTWQTGKWSLKGDYDSKPIVLTGDTTYTLAQMPPAGVAIEYDLRNGSSTLTLPEGLPDQYEIEVNVPRWTDDGAAFSIVVGDGSNEPIVGLGLETLANGIGVSEGAAGGYTLRLNKAKSRWETVQAYTTPSDSALPVQYSVSYSYQGTGATSIEITTSDGQPYDVTWADGTTATAISGATTSYTHPVSDGDVSAAFNDQTFMGVRLSGQYDFDLSEIHSFVRSIIIGSDNITTGNLSGLPSNLTYYQNSGSNTTFGDIGNLPSGLTFYLNEGQNTTSGDLAGLPSSLTRYTNQGQNTTTGDLAGLPRGLTFYLARGQNTTTGDLAGLPRGLTYYQNLGQNTTSGDLAGLPSGVTYYQNSGLNVTTGDVSGLPSGLTFYLNTGQNTVSGDLANLPSGVTYFLNNGSNTLQCLSVPNFPTSMRYMVIGGQGMTQQSVDNLLEGLAAVTTWTHEKTVDLRANSAAPSASSQVFIDAITAAGAAVMTN